MVFYTWYVSKLLNQFVKLLNQFVKLLNHFVKLLNQFVLIFLNNPPSI